VILLLAVVMIGVTAYLIGDYVGSAIQPAEPEKETPEAAIPETQPVELGEYYIAGAVERVGIYSLSEREIRVSQAVIAAGVRDGENSLIRLIRSPATQPVLDHVPLSDLLADPTRDLVVEKNDVIQVKTKETLGEPNN
jgi:hypothetical protein